MKLQIDSKGSDIARIRVEGEDYSISDIVHAELLELKHVKFAGVALPHPLIQAVTIQIRTDGTNATKALSEALTVSQKKVEELLSLAKKTFPVAQKAENAGPAATEAHPTAAA